MKPTAWNCIVSLAAAFLAMAPAAAFAVAPPYVSDDELAQKPVVVVARWPKAVVTRRELTKNNVVEEFEAHTDLIVERALRGGISPGKHKLLVGFLIGWRKDGSGLGSYTSTELLGDVDNVTRPNIWFLSRKRSWDKADPTVYLSLGTYRGVQPLELEPYFKVLQGDDRNQKIAGLLDSTNPLIVQRALEFISGGALPWPYWSRFDEWYRGKPDKTKRLVQHADAVEKLLDRNQPGLRPEAAAVYGALAGPRSVPRMRQLMADTDPAVRAVAVGILAQHRDGASADRMPNAVLGLQDGFLGCAVVESLAVWGDKQAVPALITFLQTDSYAGQDGDDLLIPALKAQSALQRITGYVFPFDVQASQRAWAKAQPSRDAKRQIKSLAGILGNDPHPLSASAMRLGSEAAVKVTNRSRQIIVLARSPTDIDCRCDNGLFGAGAESDAGKRSFVSLKPGESIQFRARLQSGFLAANPASRSLTLFYTRSRNGLGRNDWIGLLRIPFGSDQARPKRRVDGSPRR